MTKPLTYDRDLQWTLQRPTAAGIDDREVTVDYFVDDYGSEPSGLSGPPENYDPGSGALFCIKPEATDAEDQAVLLTDDEVAAIEQHLNDNPDLWTDDGHDYAYPDYD